MENPWQQENIMSVAIQNDDLGTIQALLEAGVNPYRVPPPYGRSPMYWAMHGNKKAIIELFLASEYPSDFHARDSSGRTVFEWADWYAARIPPRGVNFRFWVSQFQRKQAEEKYQKEKEDVMKAHTLLADSGDWIAEDPVRLISDFLPRDPVCQTCGIPHKEE